MYNYNGQNSFQKKNSKKIGGIGWLRENWSWISKLPKKPS